VRRDQDQQVVWQFLALKALDHLPLGIDRLDIEERVELDPLLLEDRRRHLGHGLDRERPPDGRAEMELARFTQVPLPRLGLDEEGDLERCRRARVGHTGDADHDPAAGERVEGLRRARAASAV
jgi:hypothetical protein